MSARHVAVSFRPPRSSASVTPGHAPGGSVRQLRGAGTMARRPSNRFSLMTVQIRSRWTLALAAAVLLPAGAPLRAQETGQLAAPSGRTHTVRTGDTLWDLARSYLGDPFLWPEIYRLNTEIVEDPHWIYPGEVLQLPEGSANGIAAVEPGNATPTDEPPSRAGTVFATRGRGIVGGRMNRGVIGRSERPLVRSGDYYPAPSVVREGGIRGSGRIIDRVEQAGIAVISAYDRLQQHDRVQITVPAGRTAAVGERYTTYRLDDVIGSDAQVMIPTGVVRVVDVRLTGEVVAEITDVYDQIRVDQKVTAFEPFATTPTGEGPQQVAGGSWASVVWVQNDPVLPSLHDYLVLQGGGTEVQMGDQFTLLREGMEATNGTPGPDDPETIAVAQVVKVSPGGVTVMVIDQAQPGIRKGMLARLTARMP
jgi:hypothetical protein